VISLPAALVDLLRDHREAMKGSAGFGQVAFPMTGASGIAIGMKRLQRAEEQKLLDEDRKLIEAHRPSDEEYEAKLALLRSTKPADREHFFDDLLDDPDKYFDLDDMLDFFALDLEGKTSDVALREALRDPTLHWFEQLEAVDRAGLAEEADLLRALVRAADYPCRCRCWWNPRCTYCLKPGTLNPNGVSPIPGRWFYYCTNRACTAPEKPHNWYARPTDQ
jgi:hypothetical protein